MKIVKYILMGTAIMMAGACGDNEKLPQGMERPAEPGDAFFNSEEVIDKGTSLYEEAVKNGFKTTSMVRVTANKNSDNTKTLTSEQLAERYPLDPTDAGFSSPDRPWSDITRPQRFAFFKKFLEEDMVFVQGGTFLMGATAEQGENAHVYELPVHKVTVSDFYICKFQVTQEMYSYVLKTWENFTWKDMSSTQIPMDNRTFDEMATKFCNALNAITGLHFTLPTEAQWEYAARGGRKRTPTLYAGSNDFNEVGWCATNIKHIPGGWSTSQNWPMPVGSKQPNELGLYDMSGNIAEACLDFYAPYTADDQTDPLVTADDLPEGTEQRRVCRGGGWSTGTDACRISARGAFATNARGDHAKLVGFRLVHPALDATE